MGRAWGDMAAMVLVAAIAALAISRLCLWLGSSIRPARLRLIVAHVVTLLITLTSAGHLLSTPAGPNLLTAMIVCMPAQAVWIVVDLTRLQRQEAAARLEAARASLDEDEQGGEGGET